MSMTRLPATRTTLAPWAEHLPARGWQWRDRFGTMHNPAEMETRHLFHTLRMIWNNFMPPHWRVGTVRLYAFTPFYTRPYLSHAIAALGAELACRTDTTDQWKTELAEMAEHFQRYKLATPQEKLQ